MKKLLIICNSLNMGGAEKHTVSIANGLYRRGFLVSIIHFGVNDWLYHELDPELQEKVYSFKRSSYLDFSVVRKINRIILESSPDSILAVNQLPMLYAVVARGVKFNIPIYCGYHTTNLPVKASVIFYLSSWFYLKFAKNIIYVCKAQLEFWGKRALHLPGQGVFIHNGINCEDFMPASDLAVQEARKKLELPADALCLTSVAIFRPEKGHIEMLRVLRKCLDHGRDTYLVLVGDGPEKNKIIKEAERLNVSKNIRLVGLQRDVKPYLAAADAVLLLSESETFSIAVLEALSSGRPVIGYDIGGIKEQVTSPEFGVVLEPKNIQSVASAILSLEKKNVVFAESLHANTKEKFAIVKMIDSYERSFFAK